MEKFDKNAEFIGFTLENIMTSEEHNIKMKELESKYNVLVEKIDNHVAILRDKVTTCDPLELLQYTSDLSTLSNIGVGSEIQVSGEGILLNRVTEYVQSILVSSPNHFNQKPNENQPDLFQTIVDSVININRHITEFYLSWGVKLSKEWDKKLVENIMETQLLYTVRGNRYQIYENEYLESLLSEHNLIFMELFNMDTDEIITGLDKLRYALTQGKLDPINDFMNLSRDIVENMDIEKEPSEDISAEFLAGFEAIEKLFTGTSDFNDFNVTTITEWNIKFIQELSYSLNEEQTFFNKERFSGWPIIDLPIQKRPFIKIEGKYYCFDYYSLSDNIYRAIQKNGYKTCS